MSAADVVGGEAPPAADAAGAVEVPPVEELKTLRRHGKVELIRRLKRSSPELTNEVYELAKSQVQYEAGRQARLDAKATSLLTASGLAITLAFVFGGALINLSLNREVGWWIVVAYLAAVLCGLVAAWHAIKALRVREDYLTLNDEAVFNDEILTLADRMETETEGGKGAGVRDYQRYMIVQLWEISRQHHANHEEKASWIKRGQSWLFGFIVALFLICLVIGFGLIFGHGLRQDPAAPGSPAASSADPGAGVLPAENGIHPNADSKGRGPGRNAGTAPSAAPAAPAASEEVRQVKP